MCKTDQSLRDEGVWERWGGEGKGRWVQEHEGEEEGMWEEEQSRTTLLEEQV